MGWEPGQATLRKEGGVWKQNPQALEAPSRGSFLTYTEGRKITKFLKAHGLEEDVRPHVGTTKPKYKWTRKPKRKGGDA